MSQLESNALDERLKQALAGLTVGVPVAGQLIGVSRNSSYKAAKNGEIPTIEIGNRKLVPTSWLRTKLGLDHPKAD